MTQSSLLTVAEVAKRLGLSERTVRAWIAQRRLTFVRCGRAVRVPSECVEAFIVTNTIEARRTDQ